MEANQWSAAVLMDAQTLRGPNASVGAAEGAKDKESQKPDVQIADRPAAKH